MFKNCTILLATLVQNVYSVYIKVVKWSLKHMVYGRGLNLSDNYNILGCDAV